MRKHRTKKTEPKNMTVKKPHIVVVGSVNTDMVLKGDKIPRPGETVTGGQFVMAAGGKGANQAVAAARLGANVTLIARVGADMFGDQAIENFQREGIRTDQITRDTENATGTALILVDSKGENSISVASGANFAMTVDEVEKSLAAVGPFDVLLLQLETPMEVVVAAARVARAVSATVVLDPAPAAPLSEELLRDVDFLTPNESEATLLTGCEVCDESTARSAAAKLQALGVKSVIITLGGQGSLLANSKASEMVPCPTVKVRDTTAAGDAFNGGLAYALGSGKSVQESVAWASRVGSLAVTKLGAQPNDVAEEHQREQDVGLRWCPTELAPDKNTPKRSDQSCPLSQAIRDSKSGLTSGDDA